MRFDAGGRREVHVAVDWKYEISDPRWVESQMAPLQLGRLVARMSHRFETHPRMLKFAGDRDEAPSDRDQG